MSIAWRTAFAAIVAALAMGAWTAPDAFAAPLPGGTLDPLSIPKYRDPLPIPGLMQKTPDPGFAGDYYEIAVRQFQQQVLSTGLPKTTVWSYGSVNPTGTFNYPAFTIEATVNRPVRVKWMNQLIRDPDACAVSTDPSNDTACNHLPHLLPVDQTLHWANPPQACAMGMMPMTDCRGFDPNPYTGPVPAVVHLHGSHVQEHSDGYPEAWWLPAANDIPVGYATRGSNYTQVPGAPDEPGAALYEYTNDQRATTLWFHDHSLGMTRNNVYAGPAGFYMLRGGPDDLPSGVPGGLPGGAYEIPIAVQDRSFNEDGSLFYPRSRSFFDDYEGPYAGDAQFPSDIAPTWNPEFFGNTNVVNGKTWPFLNVEPRKYRFRILNGSDSRFYILKPDTTKLTFTQIGAEGGFLVAPVVLDQLLVGPAERADVIVDFSAFTPGSTITLLNVGPDSPFGGSVPGHLRADPATTGEVMQFRVVPLTGPDTSAIPLLPRITPLRKPDGVRKVSLNELMSGEVCVDRDNEYVPGVTPPLCAKRSMPLAPLEAQLGIVDPLTGLGVPLPWMAPITENPALGKVEVWEISNFTVDAHPIHLHMVMFQVVNRQPFRGGKARPPEPWEMGFKDTVVALPGEITRVKALYDIPGLFVWHCHILSHEDNEMMRPYCVGGGCTP